MITADTITNEDIGKLWTALTANERAGVEIYGETACIIALGLPDVKPTDQERARARAVCAALINAGRVPNFTTCPRCGAGVPRSWDHLDIGEAGERYRCADLNARNGAKP